MYEELKVWMCKDCKKANRGVICIECKKMYNQADSSTQLLE